MVSETSITPALNEILDCLSTLRSKEDIYGFLRDLLTKQELGEMSRRWEAAKLLTEKIPYVEIEKRTGLSSTTIARVSHWLKDGNGGYHQAIKIAAKHKAKQQAA